MLIFNNNLYNNLNKGDRLFFVVFCVKKKRDRDGKKT